VVGAVGKIISGTISVIWIKPVFFKDINRKLLWFPVTIFQPIRFLLRVLPTGETSTGQTYIIQRDDYYSSVINL